MDRSVTIGNATKASTVPTTDGKMEYQEPEQKQIRQMRELIL